MPATLEKVQNPIRTPQRNAPPPSAAPDGTLHRASAPKSKGGARVRRESRNPRRRRATSAKEKAAVTAKASGGNESQIDNFDAFILIIFALLVDVVGVLLVLFGFDDFGILDLFGTATNAYFYFKNIPKPLRAWSTGTTVAEVIPYVGALPLKTVGVLVVIYFDRHRDKMKALEAVSGKK